MHISFITTIKICPGYEWLLDRINIYILNIQHYCKKYDIPYDKLIRKSSQKRFEWAAKIKKDYVF